jgi:Tfp pilus assembly protein PilP
MKKNILIIMLVGISLVFSCSTGKKEGPVSPVAPGSQKKIQDMKPPIAVEEEKKPEYEITGTRDPFEPYQILRTDDMYKKTPTDVLQNITLGQIALVGVILDKNPRALVQDASNTGYIIKEGMHVGENSGIVTKISSSGVTIKQHFKDYMGKVNTREVVLTLKKEEGEK